MSRKVRALKSGLCEVTQDYKAGVHNGIDIVRQGYQLDYIVAHSDGKIIQAQDGLGNMKGTNSYGNYVKIDHGNGYCTLYAHMQKGISVRNGQYVKKGQVLGYMGNTGNSYGAHLHFEVWKGGTRINPTEYLEKDLPSKINVIYQTHDKVAHKYWGEITNYNNVNYNGYAGYIGHAMDGLKVRLSNGAKVYYQAHIKGGKWLPVVSKWDNTDEGYAGIYNKDIDGISMRAEGCTLKYRVHLLNGGWLDWVSKMDINDSVHGMAGIYGRTIDAIQIQVI